MSLTNEERYLIKQAISNTVKGRERVHRGRLRIENPLPQSVKRRERKQRQRARELTEKEGTLFV